MGELDPLVLVVEDRRLDRALEELVGVAAEELVERVLAGDVEREPLAAPARPAPHLAQARDRAGEGDADRGVELADVDAQLERVGGDDREQLAGRQPGLDLAALLRRVAGPVRGDPLGQLRRPSSSSRMRAKRWISSIPRRLRRKQIVRTPSATRSASSSAASERAERRVIDRSSMTGGFHIPIRRPARGAPSESTRRKGSPTSRSASSTGLAIVAEARMNRGLGAVDARDPAQAAQHVGDVRAEHAAVGVGLVDDHPAEVGEEVAPAACGGAGRRR